MIVKMQHVAPFLLLSAGKILPTLAITRLWAGKAVALEFEAGKEEIRWWRGRDARQVRSELSTGRASAQRELPAVPRDTPVPFQSYEFIGASEKVSLRALAGCQLVEDSAVSPS